MCSTVYPYCTQGEFKLKKALILILTFSIIVLFCACKGEKNKEIGNQPSSSDVSSEKNNENTEETESEESSASRSSSQVTHSAYNEELGVINATGTFGSQTAEDNPSSVSKESTDSSSENKEASSDDGYTPGYY